MSITEKVKFLLERRSEFSGYMLDLLRAWEYKLRNPALYGHNDVVMIDRAYNRLAVE